MTKRTYAPEQVLQQRIRKDARLAFLLGRGAKLEKAEDKYGHVRTGWWAGGVWIAGRQGPQDAVETLAVG